jgi:molybdopterin/thiamine biosynthesis adenylyltransferase/rhodanese-related sulfurtransferase/molybdopterin converting factor small subunit
MKIHIPTPLRQFAAKQATVTVKATTVGQALDELTVSHPELKKHLYAEDGKLRAFVNVYLNDEDIRYLSEKENTAVKDSDSLSIIPSIAGGVEMATMTEVPAVALPSLNNDEIARYSRHLILPEVGMEGQQKLKAARVLCVGTGGLGSPLAFYLAAAGVGTLGLVDFDVVDSSNLQRQIIHSTRDVGRPKLDSAEEKLKALNPHMNVVKYNTMLLSSNALEIFKDFDIVADGTDNFPTRYLVNDACVLSGKPNVYGSIFRFEGQASVFATEQGPCYRCLYPEPPPPGLVPSCAEGGVLGILPGLVGVIQATEVIKLILGVGDPLIGRLLLVDSLGMRFRELKLRKNPDCPVCGTHPTVTQLIDYEQFCGIQPEPAKDAVQVNGIEQIDVTTFKQQQDAGKNYFLLDVREPHEFKIAQIGGHLIPLGDVQKRVGELDREREIVVHCKMGGRSQKAAEFLQQSGFKVKNLAGGIQAWSEQIDPRVPKY